MIFNRFGLKGHCDSVFGEDEEVEAEKAKGRLLTLEVCPQVCRHL